MPGSLASGAWPKVCGRCRRNAVPLFVGLDVSAVVPAFVWNIPLRFVSFHSVLPGWSWREMVLFLLARFRFLGDENFIDLACFLSAFCSKALPLSGPEPIVARPNFSPAETLMTAMNLNTYIYVDPEWLSVVLCGY